MNKGKLVLQSKDGYLKEGEIEKKGTVLTQDVEEAMSFHWWQRKKAWETAYKAAWHDVGHFNVVYV